MGVLVNQGVKGNLSYKKNMAIFTGVNSKGTRVKIDIIGGYKDGKIIPLDIDKFKQGFKELIVQSANFAIEKTASESKKKQIEKELNDRLKRFEKGDDVSINIEESMGLYVPDKDAIIMSAIGTPQKTKKGRIFYNIKPIEDQILNKNYVPIKATVRAMVMKREPFSNLSNEEKKSIKYKKDSKDASNWKWKKVSVSDLERGNVDLLTVQIEGELAKAFANPRDLVSILAKDEAYIDYATTQSNRELRGSRIVVEDYDSKKIVVPRTSIFVPEHRILAEAESENIREFLKKIFEKANKNASADNRFYVPFEGENNNLIIDETNIEEIKSDRIARDTFNIILSQFEYKYADMIQFAGVKDPDSQTMQYIKATDAIHIAKNRKDYVNATKQLYKMIERDGLNNTPVTISFKIETENFSLKDNLKYQEKQKEAIKNLLTQMSKDMTSPLEKVFVRQLMIENDSEYVQKIKENVAKAISIDTENKKITYNKDDNGFTLKDKMFIEVHGRVLNSEGFVTEDGKKIPSTKFTGLMVSVNDKENFVGLSGVGGRKFEYPKSTSILSSMGMAYITHPLKNLHVNKDNIPTLQKNPITGEETNVAIEITETKENVTTETESTKEETKENVTTETEITKEETKGLFDFTKEESKLFVAKENDIRDEMAMSLGDGIDLDDLASFLEDDEEIDIERANEVMSEQPQDGISNLAP